MRKKKTLVAREVTMQHIQLEFNIDGLSEDHVDLSFLNKRVNALSESVDKVRKKLFAEVGELKKLCAQLKQENEELKSKLGQDNELNSWTYGEENYLCYVQKHKEA